MEAVRMEPGPGLKGRTVRSRTQYDDILYTANNINARWSFKKEFHVEFSCFVFPLFGGFTINLTF